MEDERYNNQSSFFNGSNSSNNDESNYTNALCIYTCRETTPSPTPLQIINSNADEEHPIPCNIPRPRGRPRGSKNKRTLIEENMQGLETFYIRIQRGTDVISEVRQFAYNNNIGVTIISGSGYVYDITLEELVPNAIPINTFAGPFQIVSLSEAFSPFSSQLSEVSSCFFGITLAGTQGELCGGVITWSIVTAATEVVLKAAAFKETRFYKLPEINGEQKVKEENLAAAPSESGGINMENRYPPKIASSFRALSLTPLPENLILCDQLAFQPHPY